MKSKKGKISIVVTMVVVVITAVLILNIFGEPIKKAFAAVTDPLLKKIGLEEDDSEQEEVKQELLENAQKVFNDFKTVIEHCKDSEDLRCACGKMDFTQLNRYSILLSNKRDTGNTYLNLLGSDGLPVQPQETIDTFPTLPKDIFENVGKFDDYKNINNDILFSIEKVIYKKTGGSEEEKFKGKMHSIYFSKPGELITVFDKYDNKIPMYICRSFGCCGDVPVSSEFTSTCTHICSTKVCIAGVDNRDTIKNCGDGFVFEEDDPPDDYCICGTGSENVIPLNYDNPPTCIQICDRAGLVCMISIDDGTTIKKCDDDSIRFEEYDDYCICGDASQRVVPSPLPANDKYCKDLCPGGIGRCMIGIDDGNNIKDCVKEHFDFETSPQDDYCICGDASQRVVPSPLPANDKYCKDLCPGGIGRCMIGIDDGNNIKDCVKEHFDFETSPQDDYCFCGDASKKVVPLDYTDDPTCTQICSLATCRKGVQNTDNRLCTDKFTFDENDDYCVCGGDSEIIYGIPS